MPARPAPLCRVFSPARVRFRVEPSPSDRAQVPAFSSVLSPEFAVPSLNVMLTPSRMRLAVTPPLTTILSFVVSPETVSAVVVNTVRVLSR